MAQLRNAKGTKGLFTDGDWILSDNMDKAGTIGVIQLKHVGVGEFLRKDFQFISEKTFRDLGCTEVLPGDVLISRMADPIARACIVPRLPFRLVTAVDVSILRVDEQTADPLFISHLCNSLVVRNQAETAGRGTTRNRITRTELEELEVPLPDLSEQKRIARLLEQADRVGRTRRHALELSDTFLPAVFLELFGDPKENPRKWPQKYLSEVCVRFSDGPFGSNLKSEHYRPSGVRVVRLNNIGVGEFLDENQAYISPPHFEALRKHECLPGDVLIGTLGDPNLRACIQPQEIRVAVNKADCVQARPDLEKASAQYLCGLLNMPTTLHLVPGMVHGQTRGRVSMGELAELPIPVPPLLKQQQFAALVEQTELLRADQREALRQADHLFQSLLYRAFGSK